MESDWKSLHPASVLVNLLPTAWRVVRSAWPLALAIFWGDRLIAVDGFLLLLFVLMPIWRTVLHFLTFRYRVSGGRLELQSGLLNRQVRVIPPERIQNVELTRNVFHRMSGLVEVRVETASGTDVEGQLSALSEDEAHALMQALDTHRSLAPDETQEAEALVQHGIGDLLRYGLSSVQLGLVAVTLGVLYELSLSDPLQAQEGFELLGWAGGSAALVLVVTGAWLFGSARALVRHWNFTLTQQGDRLVAREGLFTQRSVELSTRRVQAVSYREPLLRRWLGFGTLAVDTAANREGAGGTQLAEAVIPVVPRDEAPGLLSRLFPSMRGTLSDAELRPPHPKALIRAIVASTTTSVLIAGLASWWLWPGGLIAWLLVPLLWTDAWLDHRHQGWRLGDRYLVSRVGFLRRTTQIVPLEKLQSLELVQSFLARRWGLARLRVRVAGTRVAMPWMDFDTAFQLELTLLERLETLLAERAPALDDHQHAPREQDPGDGLGHQAHQEERAHQDPLPGEQTPGVPEADRGRDEPDADDDQRPQGHGDGER